MSYSGWIEYDELEPGKLYEIIKRDNLFANDNLIESISGPHEFVRVAHEKNYMGDLLWLTPGTNKGLQIPSKRKSDYLYRLVSPSSRSATTSPRSAATSRQTAATSPQSSTNSHKSYFKLTKKNKTRKRTNSPLIYKLYPELRKRSPNSTKRFKRSRRGQKGKKTRKTREYTRIY